MKALVTFSLGKLNRIYEGLQQYQWQVHEPLCHGRPVLPASETPASDAICTDMTCYTGGVTALPKTAIAANILSTGSNPTDTSASNPTAPSSLPAKEERVDYLAGLVALSCMLVTAIHFCLTFSPTAITPGAYIHFKSEIWVRGTIGSYFLDLIWIVSCHAAAVSFKSCYLLTHSRLGRH